MFILGRIRESLSYLIAYAVGLPAMHTERTSVGAVEFGVLFWTRVLKTERDQLLYSGRKTKMRLG